MHIVLHLWWVRRDCFLLLLFETQSIWICWFCIFIHNQRAEDEFSFSCKFDECAEAKEANPECTLQFTIDSCCSTNKICNKTEIEALPRCWSDGLEFVKGNLIYSPNAPCYKCLCDEKFDNKTDISQNPSCKPVECGIELHQLSFMQLGCVPVYFDNGLCCPFEFRCRSYFFFLLFIWSSYKLDIGLEFNLNNFFILFHSQ